MFLVVDGEAHLLPLLESTTWRVSGELPLSFSLAGTLNPRVTAALDAGITLISSGFLKNAGGFTVIWGGPKNC